MVEACCPGRKVSSAEVSVDATQNPNKGKIVNSTHGIGWHDVEVLSDPLGKPVLRLSGRARALSHEQGLRQWSISLSHSRDQAVAFVVATD